MQEKRKRFSAKNLVYGALFAALAVVLGRVTAVYPVPGAKYTLDKFLLFMSGMFFGPAAGAMIGFVSDLIGGQLFGIGWTAPLCVPAVLYGFFGGVFRKLLAKKFTLPRLTLAYLVPILIGSILYQSPVLAALYYPSTFWEATYTYLVSRSIQFAIMLVLEVALIYVLIRTNIFSRVGLWPRQKKAEGAVKMNAEEAVAYIHSVTWKGSRPGLERTLELLKKMGDPQKRLKFVHIAGTNGKGSTAAMTASILRKAGYKTGLFTSPSIYRFNERMQINGQQISDEDLAEVTAFVKPLAESMEDVPTEFELVSCIGFEYFKRQGCDIVVLEVGMGGALDSTNVIPCPEVAVITNIGLDHTDYLGHTLGEIARTKAGIIKSGGSAVLYPGQQEVEDVITQICRERQVSLKLADFASLNRISHSLEGQVFDCGDRKGLKLPLLGEHQLHNAAVVLAVVDTLKEKGWQISEENIYDGMASVTWPGRFDIMRRDPLFIIDGGHNPQCIEALVQNIKDYLTDRRVVVLAGVLADKDYGEMFRPVMGLVEQFVCITPPNPRRLEAADLAKHLQEKGCIATPCDTIAQGVQQAIALAGADGVVLCFGSLYSIGDICAALEKE